MALPKARGTLGSDVNAPTGSPCKRVGPWLSGEVQCIDQTRLDQINLGYKFDVDLDLDLGQIWIIYIDSGQN